MSAISLALSEVVSEYSFRAFTNAYRESWSYSIIPERLIAYNHGKINEIQVEGIEKNLSRIISQFEDLKRDLVFLLSEKEE